MMDELVATTYEVEIVLQNAKYDINFSINPATNNSYPDLTNP